MISKPLTSDLGRRTVSWLFRSSPPMTGSENMRRDAELLEAVEQGVLPPTLRFFRFKKPTVSFGRLQKLSDVAPLTPQDWDVIQRPTGGGIVFHKDDLCFSLCWPSGLAPLPKRPQDHYRWIHSIVHEVLLRDRPARMAACCEVSKPEEPFSHRACFQNPVGYDLLIDQQKIVGGALRYARRATLYQGSLQMTVSPELESRLTSAFKTRLAPAS